MGDHVAIAAKHGQQPTYLHEEIGWTDVWMRLQAGHNSRVKDENYTKRTAQNVSQRADAYDFCAVYQGLAGAKQSSAKSQSPVRLLKRGRRAFTHLPSIRIRAERRAALRAFLTKKKIGR